MKLGTWDEGARVGLMAIAETDSDRKFLAAFKHVHEHPNTNEVEIRSSSDAIIIEIERAQ